MNYYNPYFSMTPYTNLATTATHGGLFRSLFGGVRSLNWGSILNNTQRTLGIINQAIPVVKQMSPVVKNARTMFQVMNEFKKIEEPPAKINNNFKSTSKKVDDINTTSVSEHQPTFFL